MASKTRYTPEEPAFVVVNTTAYFDTTETESAEILPRLLRAVNQSRDLKEIQLARHTTWLIQEHANEITATIARIAKSDRPAAQKLKLQRSFLLNLLKDPRAWEAAFNAIQRTMPEKDKPAKHTRPNDDDEDDNEPEQPSKKARVASTVAIRPRTRAAVAKAKEGKVVVVQGKPIKARAKPAKAKVAPLPTLPRIHARPTATAPIAPPRQRMRDFHEDPDMDSDDSEDEGLIQSGKGAYVIVKHLNSGGEGSVHLAKHHRTGQVVAVKKSLRSGPDAIKRMQNEAHLLLKSGAGKDPYIIGFINFNVLGDSCEMALEFAVCDVFDLVCKYGRIELAEGAYIMRDAVRGVRALHARNIVHRDIKPENFLVVRRGNKLFVVISDVGHAKDISNNPLGRTATQVGTFGKRPPEMIKEYLPKPVDIWMLGIMFFELLEQTYPWREAQVDRENEEELFAWMKINMQVLQLSPHNDHWSADSFLRQTVYQHAQGRATAEQLLDSPLFDEACSSERFQEVFARQLRSA